MKTLGTVLTIVSVLVVLACIVIGIVVDYQINRDINGWKSRAQVSSEPNDMLEYMTNVQSGMAGWEMTTGYAALIFKTPENDMGLIFKTVQRHVDQARVLTAMDRATPEYQTGLDNLRGSIREIDLHANYYWAVHQGLVIWIPGILFAIIGLGGILLLYITYDQY